VSIIIFSTIFVLNIIIWKIYQSRILDRLLTLCMWTAVIMWYSLPAAIAGIYKEETPFSIFYLYQDNVSRGTWIQDFTILFVLESLAVLCVLILILFNFSKKQYSWIQKKTCLKYNIDSIPSQYKMGILLVGGAMLSYQVATFGNNADYLINNSADAYGSNDATSQIIAFVKTISYSMVILIAIYEQRKIGLVRVAFGQIIFESILSTMGGGRIYILTPLIIFIFRVCSSDKVNIGRDKHLNPNNCSIIALSSTNNSSITSPNDTLAFASQKNLTFQKDNIRLITTFLVTLLFLIYIFLPLSKSIGEARSAGEFNLYDVVIDTFSSRKQSSPTSTETSKKMDDIESIFIKLDSFTNGSILTSTSGYGTGGIMPYIGSVLVFIPRFIVPEKPVAGTSDGTIYTHPSRLVTRSLGIQSDAMNVPSSPLSIAFWHFGYSGFIIFIVFGFLHFKYLNYLFSSSSFVYKAMGISSLNLPAFTGVFSAPDVIIKDCVSLFIIIYLVDLHRKFTRTVV
jgi:hypothetical protein